MAESWSEILQRAGSNLSVDLSDAASSTVKHKQASRRAPSWKSLRPSSFAESRERLSRELDAIGGRTPDDAGPPLRNEGRTVDPASALHRPYMAPSYGDLDLVIQPPRHHPQTGKSWRNLAAISISGAVIGLTGYTLYYNWGAGAEAAGQTPPPSTIAANLGGNRFGPTAGPIGTANAAPFKPSSATPASAVALSTPAKTVLAPSATPAHNTDVRTAALAPKATINSLSRQAEDALLARAYSQLSRGDISGARTTYETIAKYGSAKGAFGVASTYDAAVLAQHPVKGLAPDARLAREWYAKAAELGLKNPVQPLNEAK